MDELPEFASFGRYSTEALRVIFAARHELARLGGQEVAPEHLLLALLQPGSGSAYEALGELPKDALRQAAETRALVSSGPTPTTEMHLSQDTKDILDRALGLSSAQIRSEHLLLALLEGESDAGRLLREHGLTVEAVKSRLG